MKKPYLIFASSILAAAATAIAQTQPAKVPILAEPGRSPAPVAVPPPSPPAPGAELPPPAAPQRSVYPVAPAPPAALPAVPQPPQTSPRWADPTRPLTPPLKGALPPPMIVEGVMQEEGEINLEAAVRSYEAAIDQFDQQRENAANAIFRLGETLRKLGRNEEAKLQYGRVLREFPDLVPLAKISHERFSMLADAPSPKRRSVRGAGRGSAPYTDIDFAPTGNVQAQRESIKKEIALVEEQLRAAEGLVATGLGSREAIIPLKREILQLERRLATLDEPSRDDQRGAPDALEIAPSPQPKARTESGRMTRSPLKASPNSNEDRILSDETQDLQRELEEQIQASAMARRELAASREKLDMVRESKPESLPQPVSNDERYTKRKAAYEAAVTASPTGEAAQQKSAEERDQALQQLHTWVEQIYVPELESALRFAEKRAKQLEQQLAETRARLQQMVSARREKVRSIGR